MDEKYTSTELLTTDTLVNELKSLGWERLHIAMILKRFLMLATEGGEDYVQIARRLNPQRQVRQPWMPKMDREQAIRESPALDLALLARVRDARSRLNT